MSSSGMYVNRNAALFGSVRGAAPHSLINAPILSTCTWLFFYCYMFSLAITQTVYGWPFMALRWVMLGALTASSAADLILASKRLNFGIRTNNGSTLLVYLLLTLGTVIYAENWMFSGMRWAAHAAMLVIFLITIPQMITVNQISRLVSVIKYLLAVLVVFSWVFPAPADGGDLYRGAMGNANAMGHIGFLSALLFFQTAVCSSLKRVRNFASIFAVVSVMTVWRSGARSSMIALIFGVVLLCYYHRKSLRGLVLTGLLVGAVAMVSFPKLPQTLFRFAQKTDRYAFESATAMQSRLPVWSAAYEGFKQRPVLGWGFGADSHISPDWEFKLTSHGIIERDPVNDFLFMMEGGGVVGLAAYLLLILMVIKQRPNWREVGILRSNKAGMSCESDTSLLHAHVILFVIPVCLFILNQFDNTALSAGNLISVILWIFAGCAATLRYEIERRHTELRAYEK